MEKPKLNRDVHSLYNSILLGAKGTEVDIISVHGNVTIVSDKDGNRFSCMSVDLTDEEIIPDGKPAASKEPITKTVQRKVKTKVTAPILNQTELF